jgi:RND family efflux transporter MFP subunit
MPVEIVTLTPKPVEQTGEFVGTIKSRKSTTVQPQAEGIITHIAVKSGDRVSPGAVILEIDAGPQRSAVAVLEGIHAAREADATFAKQQAARAKTMLDVGAGSQQEYDQAVAQQKAAEAQLKAVEDQIRQQQAELA